MKWPLCARHCARLWSCGDSNGQVPWPDVINDFVYQNYIKRGAWVAQSVEYPTSAQITTSWFVSSSPELGVSAVSAEPTLLHILCPPLCLPLPGSHSLQSKIIKH